MSENNENIKFCLNCGYEYKEDWKYCLNCGQETSFNSDTQEQNNIQHTSQSIIKIKKVLEKLIKKLGLMLKTEFKATIERYEQERENKKLNSTHLISKKVYNYENNKPNLSKKDNNGCSSSCLGCLGIIVLFIFFAIICSPSNNNENNQDNNNTESSYTENTAEVQQSVDLDSAKTWLEKHYNEYPIGGGWEVNEILIKDGKVNVGITIPYNSVEAIQEAKGWQKLQLATVGCPNKYEDIWNYVRPEHIEMVLLDYSGNLIWNAQCKYNNGLR